MPRDEGKPLLICIAEIKLPKKDDWIVSGSTDRTLRVWSAETGKCIETLYGHCSTVRCMALAGNEVVSGSRDNTLRLWDLTTLKCKAVLVGHFAAVRCVCFDGKKIVSGSYDNTVKVIQIAVGFLLIE